MIQSVEVWFVRRWQSCWHIFPRAPVCEYDVSGLNETLGIRKKEKTDYTRNFGNVKKLLTAWIKFLQVFKKGNLLNYFTNHKSEPLYTETSEIQQKKRLLDDVPKFKWKMLKWVQSREFGMKICAFVQYFFMWFYLCWLKIFVPFVNRRIKVPNLQKFRLA